MAHLSFSFAFVVPTAVVSSGQNSWTCCILENDAVVL
jgi:hypothetical protein